VRKCVLREKSSGVRLYERATQTHTRNIQEGASMTTNTPEYVTLSHPFPCAGCGSAATVAQIGSISNELLLQHPALRGNFLLSPICDTCITMLIEPQEYGICAVRQNISMWYSNR
jgi:hypothetical protein